MKNSSNYAPMMQEAEKLASTLEVDLSEKMFTQEGSPSERFDQVLGAVCELLREANEQFGPDLPDFGAERE